MERGCWMKHNFSHSTALINGIVNKAEEEMAKLTLIFFAIILQ